jgi:D-sedoheptulose 7-phosphate isomerase
MSNSKIDFESSISNHINESINALKKIPVKLSGNISEAVNVIIQTFTSGHKLLIAGNGGSAADAQHIAAEFVVRLSKNLERPALAAIALSTDSSILTASSNDNGFRTVFKRQLEALAQNGDCFMALSTSGNSENLLSAVKYAKQENIKTIGLLGNDGGAMRDLIDIAITVDHSSTQHVQEAHICIYHIICDLVERSMYT